MSREVTTVHGEVRALGGLQMQDINEARRQQQVAQNIKAAEYAVKQKEKEDEKRKKKIEQWEKMSGLGPGQKLGGMEETMGPGYHWQRGAADEARQEAMEAARQRMQHEHDIRVAHNAQELYGVSQEEKRMQEREEAKRKKRIEEWERMNPAPDVGHRLGHCTGTKPKLNPGSGAPETAPAAPEQDVGDGWEISEQAKREAMRAARLRMQQAQDQRLAMQH